jgi:type IV pilus assembly protein PilO
VKTASLPRPVLIAALAAANVVVALAGWFVLVSPQRQQAASTARAVNQTQAEILQAQNAATASSSASAPTTATQKQQPILTADLYRLAKAMPSDQDMPDLLLELDQVSRAAGVTLLTISPGAVLPATTYSVVPLNLTVSGDFYSLTDLLYRLRRLVVVRNGALDATGRLFSVGTLALTPRGTGKTLNATLTVDAYVYGTAAAGVTAPAPTGTSTTSTTTTTVTTGATSTPGG